MNQGKIHVRYARALFEAGKEKGILPELHHDMAGLLGLCRDSEEFAGLLGNPVIKNSRKKEILRESLQPFLHAFTLRFVLLVTDNNRENALPGICRDFLDMVRADRGILPVALTTAQPLSPGSLDRIREVLRHETGKEIELTQRIKPEILGGMVLRIEDLQYDGSITTQLKKIRNALEAR